MKITIGPRSLKLDNPTVADTHRAHFDAAAKACV